MLLWATKFLRFCLTSAFLFLLAYSLYSHSATLIYSFFFYPTNTFHGLPSFSCARMHFISPRLWTTVSSTATPLLPVCPLMEAMFIRVCLHSAPSNICLRRCFTRSFQLSFLEHIFLKKFLSYKKKCFQSEIWLLNVCVKQTCLYCFTLLSVKIVSTFNHSADRFLGRYCVISRLKLCVRSSYNGCFVGLDQSPLGLVLLHPYPAYYWHMPGLLLAYARLIIGHRTCFNKDTDPGYYFPVTDK